MNPRKFAWIENRSKKTSGAGLSKTIDKKDFRRIICSGKNEKMREMSLVFQINYFGQFQQNSWHFFVIIIIPTKFEETLSFGIALHTLIFDFA